MVRGRRHAGADEAGDECHPAGAWAWRRLQVSVPSIGLFLVKLHTLGGSAPVRRFLVQLIWNLKIDHGKVLTSNPSGSDRWSDTIGKVSRSRRLLGAVARSRVLFFRPSARQRGGWVCFF
jgi:hypothetical protein